VPASHSALIDGDLLDNVLIGTDADDSLNGLAGDDLLIGGAGDDELDGEPGRDRLIGNGGDDTYFVDQAMDEVVEAADEGLDLVVSCVSYALSENVEALGLTGDSNLMGVGNRQDNFLLGNDGNNLLLGLAGNDTCLFSEGDDVFNGGAGEDAAFYGDLEIAIAFEPTTASLNKDTLGTDQLINIETVVGNENIANRITMPELGNDALAVNLSRNQLTLINTETGVERQYEVVNFSDVRGSSQDDLMIGNAAENRLEGAGGNDILRGEDGRDLQKDKAIAGHR